MPWFPTNMTDINYLDRMNLNHLPLFRKQYHPPSIFVVLQQPFSLNCSNSWSLGRSPDVDRRREGFHVLSYHLSATWLVGLGCALLLYSLLPSWRFRIHI